MTAHDLLKRTPIRIAVVFTALFALTVITLFATLYWRVGAELEHLIRERVTETQDALTSIDDDSGFENLVSVVASESSSVRDADGIFLLVDSAGAYRAGNVRDITDFSGWAILKRESLPEIAEKGDAEDWFYASWQPVSKGKLLVGYSNREVRNTQHLLLKGLAWGLGIIALLATIFGTYLARQAQRRIGALATTLSAVSHGDVASRVPLSGTGDDLDHIGEQINRMLGHLQRLIQNVNQASSDIAHDLKKPIGRVRQRLERVRRGAKGVDDYEESVERALIELDSITETFEALLRIAQLEAGARKARFSTIDLGQVLRDVCDVYEAVVEDEGSMLRIDRFLDRPAEVSGDKELLVQLIANLIENSVRHCPKNTRIGLGLADGGATYTVTVTDTGPGIPEVERANVFRRLYRLEPARSTPGSGLGLSLVAAVADLHEATLRLSDNAPGLRVEIDFPKLHHSSS